MSGVLLFSDEGLSSGNSSNGDDRSLSLKDILGQVALDDPNIVHIALNPVASTIMKRALKRIAKMASIQYPHSVSHHVHD